MNAKQVTFAHQTNGQQLMIGFGQPVEMMEAFTRGLKMTQREYKGARVKGVVNDLEGGEKGLPVFVKSKHIGWLTVK